MWQKTPTNISKEVFSMQTNKILISVLFVLVLVSFISIIFADTLVGYTPVTGSSADASTGSSTPTATDVYGRYEVHSSSTSILIVPKTMSGRGDSVQKGFEISVINITTTSKRLNDSERQALIAAYGDIDYTNPDLPTVLRDSAAYHVEAPISDYEYVPNVHLKVEHFRVSTRDWADVPGCSDIQTTESRTQYDTVRGRDAIIYYATCPVPKSLYDNTCTDFRATIIPQAGDNLRYDQESSRLCDEKIGGVDAFTHGISNIFDPAGLTPADARYWKYIGFAALLGMLLSSLYFSGKSPISLLDIAQPRLPSPKGLTAGGQILGPFGYTEMKKTEMDQQKARAKLLEAELKNIKLTGGTSSLISSMVSSMKLNAVERNVVGEAERAKTFATALGSLYVKMGGDVHSIRPLLTKHVSDFNKLEHEQMARVLNEIEQRGTPRDLLMARTLRNQLEGMLLYKKLNTLTGVGPTTSGAIRGALIGKTVGGGRYSVLSYWLAPMVDSTIRSAPVIGRFAKATIAEAGLFVANRFHGGKGFERLEQYDSRLATKQGILMKYGWGKAIHGLYEMLKNQHPDYIPVGSKAPVLGHMAELYAKLERESYRDLMRYALKEIYKNKGIELELEKLGIEDLHGVLLTDVLERAGINAAKVSELRILEEKMREILNSSAHGEQKLAELMKLAEANGVRLQGSIFESAAEGLNHIRNSALPEHIKLFELQEHLAKFYPEREGEHTGDFRYTVGRKFNEQEAFEQIVLRRMIHDIETKLYSPQEGMGIKEALEGAQVDLQNRVYTLNPLAKIEGMIKFDKDGKIIKSKELLDAAEQVARQSFGGGNLPKELLTKLTGLGIDADKAKFSRGIVTGEELIEMHERGLKNLRSLLTEEGRKALREFGFDPNTATTKELKFILYGGPDLLKKRGYSADEIKKVMAGEFGLMGSVDKTTGQVFWPGTNIELKPNQEHWKADMGRLWAFAPSDQESYALAQWIKNRVARTHEAVYNVDIEGKVDKLRNDTIKEQEIEALKKRGMPDTEARKFVSQDEIRALAALGMKETDAMKFLTEGRGLDVRRLWLKDELLEDVVNRFNSMTPGAYGVTHDRIKDLSYQTAAMLAGALEKIGGHEDDAAYLRGRQSDGNPVTEAAIKKKLRELLENPEINKKFQAYMEKAVSYSDVSTGKQVWVMLYEGGMVPYVKGMKLSDNDRVLGGYVAIKDAQGRWKRFDPNSTRINLTELQEKELREKETELDGLRQKKLMTLVEKKLLSEEEAAELQRLTMKIRKSEVLSEQEENMLTNIRAKFGEKVLDDISEKRLAGLSDKLKFQLAWNALAGEQDPKKLRHDMLGEHWTWDGLLTELKAWKQGDFDKEKVYNAVVWRYANVTHDYGSHWQESGIQVVPKREAAPLAPQMFRFFTGGKESEKMELLKPVRNAILGLGDALSRISISAAGPILDASYAVTPFSEYYRLQSWRLAHDIFKTSNWNELLADIPNASDRAKVKALYEGVALSHGAYHQVWDYAIDRNPWRHSTSYGAHQAWGSFFHFGPAEPFPLRLNLRTLYSGRTGGEHAALGDLNSTSSYQRGLGKFSQVFNRIASGLEWGMFNAQYGWQTKVARALFLPYATATRAFQMSIQGYPSRWDIKSDPLKPWNYSNPRVGEAFRAMSPFSSFSSISIPGFVQKIIPEGLVNLLSKIPIARRFKGDTIDISEPWGSSLERTHLAGREFGGGLKQTPQDISFIRTGVFASARTGEANPGASYYDYRAYLHMDPAMAEYLAYRSGEVSAYFRGDNYVKQQAHTGTIKRTVAGEAKAIRAEEELRGFGMLHNPLYAWFNPALFLWHSGFGLIPFLPDYSPKEIIFNIREKRMKGEKFSIKEMAVNKAREWKDDAVQSFAPVGVNADIGLFRPKTWGNLFKPSTWKEAEFAPGTAWHPGRKVFAASCGRCGTGGYLGTMCRKCQTVLYDAPYTIGAPGAPGSREVQKRWAASWSIWTRQQQQ